MIDDSAETNFTIAYIESKGSVKFIVSVVKSSRDHKKIFIRCEKEGFVLPFSKRACISFFDFKVRCHCGGTCIRDIENRDFETLFLPSLIGLTAKSNYECLVIGVEISKYSRNL